MARKTRRQKQRSAARQATPVRPVGARTDQASGSPGSSVAAPDPLDVTLDAEVAADEDAIADELSADRSTASAAPAEPSLSAVSSPRSATAAAPLAAGAPASSRRRIERLSQAAPQQVRAGRPGRGPSNAAALFQPLETEDAAIPFDRVPYVPADLRRVLVIALMMVALIIIAAVVVTHVVH